MGLVTGRGYSDAFAITPSDSVDFTAAQTYGRSVIDGIFVGGAGNVTVVTMHGTTVLFVGLSAGDILPARAKRVNSTGTTATSLVGLMAWG